MLNEHAAGQGSGHLLVIEYYVLQHVLAIIFCLKKLEPPEEGKSIEFPRKHAILADCTTIDWLLRANWSTEFSGPRTPFSLCFWAQIFWVSRNFGCVPRVCKRAEKPQTPRIFLQKSANQLGAFFCRFSSFAVVIRLVPHACKHSANSTDLLRLKHLGPETDEKWCPRAGISGVARQRRGPLTDTNRLLVSVSVC